MLNIIKLNITCYNHILWPRERIEGIGWDIKIEVTEKILQASTRIRWCEKI